MPYKCIVTGCRSGYDHTKTDNNEKEKVQMHKFPTDESRRSVWINRIPRKLNKKEKNSRICEKHFLLSDYVTERNDKQNRRINRKGKILKKRKLKEDAVPSVWPGLPAHLTRTPTVPRKTARTSSEARTAAVEAMAKEIENDRVIKDSFSSLEELKTKINEINLPATTQVIEKDSAIIFISVSM